VIRFFACVSLLSACPPSPPQPVEPPFVVVDGSITGTPEHRACAILVDVGCKEGSSPKCEEAFHVAPSSHVAAFNIDCVLAAMSKADARACGVRCGISQ
jgi:hypothetical protein